MDTPTQLRRRRAASWRCPPLADGRRDPLDPPPPLVDITTALADLPVMQRSELDLGHRVELIVVDIGTGVAVGRLNESLVPTSVAPVYELPSARWWSR
jgi:hypothetical protein